MFPFVVIDIFNHVLYGTLKYYLYLTYKTYQGPKQM